MKTTFKIEFIGADSADWLDGMTRQWNAVSPGLGDALIGGSIGKPWVAEITGPDAKYGLARQFVRAKRDYRNANSKGSRGVELWYVLESGKFYEVHQRVSWKNSRRWFCRVTDSGDIQEVSKTEVLEWAKSQSASTS